jgi:glycosyltransferase involved in cell wall biosynthesis
MLVTNVGGLPEIVDHLKDGYISSTDPKEISKHILNYFSDENNEIKMSAALSKKQQFYSWGHFTDEILK